jgi:hypothetical protein
MAACGPLWGALARRTNGCKKHHHAAQFAVERLIPADDAGSELSAIHRDYRGTVMAANAEEALELAMQEYIPERDRRRTLVQPAE